MLAVQVLRGFRDSIETRHHLFFPHFPNPTRNETLSVTSVSTSLKSAMLPRAPVPWHSCNLIETHTYVEESPPLVRTRPQHVTARQLLMSWKDADRAWVYKATSPPAEQPPNFFVTKQLSRSGTLLLILLV
jgi:hypothetical protein